MVYDSKTRPNTADTEIPRASTLKLNLSTGSTLHKRREQQVPTANMDQDWNQGAPHPHACHYSPS